MNTNKDTTVSTSDLLPGTAPGDRSEALTETEQVRRYPDRSGDHLRLVGELTVFAHWHKNLSQTMSLEVDEIHYHDKWYGGLTEAASAIARRLAAESDDNGGAGPGNSNIKESQDSGNKGKGA